MPVKSTAKQDLATYKELKTLKTNFDKEMKSVKTAIKLNDFSRAKSDLNNCGKYIINMESVIDKLPDRSSIDVVKSLVPGVISILGSVIATSINNSITKKDISDLEKEGKNKISEIRNKYKGYEKDIDDKFDKEGKDLRSKHAALLKDHKNEKDRICDDINKNKESIKNTKDKRSEYIYKDATSDLVKSKKTYSIYSDLIKKSDKVINLRTKRIGELTSELNKVSKDYDKQIKDTLKKIDGLDDQRKNEKDANNKKKIEEYIKTNDENYNKILNRNDRSDFNNAVISTTAMGAGISGTLLSLKPLKSKAKSILNKCKKELESTRLYLIKAEQMSKAVRESYDETFDDIYIAYCEGCIDEFEYDTLVDHLLD